MALDKEVFSTAKFKTWAKGNVILVQVDFPQGKRQSKKEKAQNEELKKKFQSGGYPTVIVASPDGKELARKVGYSPKSGPDAYLESLTARMTKGASAAQ
jgi:thioredoxin-related protein